MYYIKISVRVQLRPTGIMQQTCLLLRAILVFTISTQYPHYDQITTELHPEYMHMTGNQLDDALKILMISQQNSKRQQ